MLKPPQKIETSIHKKFILECIEKGMNAPEIEKALLAKGAKITNPTIRKYMEYVRKQGLNITQFKDQAEANALQINDKIKSLPELTTIISRRHFLVEELLQRRKKVLEFINEGKRASTIFTTLVDINLLLEDIKATTDSKKFSEIKQKVIFLQEFCSRNFLRDSIYPQIEDTVRKYTMDIHEICKYVEQWTSKYEVESLMEKLTELITKSAVSTFGPLLKKQTQEERQKYINKFIQEVENAVNSIRQDELQIGEIDNENK